MKTGNFISNNPARLASRMMLCLLLFLCCITGWTQEDLLKSEYSYRRYTTQDGLPSIVMLSVFKDSKGFLWQGTQKGGSTFNGFKFTPYALEKFPFIQRIEETDGQIRFLYGNELFYPEKELIINLSDTLSLQPNNSYSLPANQYIFENQTGKKYFVKTAGDTISEVMDIPQLQRLRRCKVYLDLQQNALYIPDNGAKKVHIYSLRNNCSQIIENVNIETFINHSRLGLLGVGDTGIYKIEDNKAELYIPFTFEMQNKIAKEARNGDIYIMDFYNIYRVRNDKIEPLYHNSSLTIWDITLDNDDNLWMATNKGLFNFFHFDFKNYSVTGHSIRSATQDDSGTYWFAGENEDIFRFSDGHFKPVNYPLNYNSSIISFQAIFSHNNITYFLMDGGILIHSNNRFHWADVPSEYYYTKMVVYGHNLLAVGMGVLLEITPDGKIVKTFNEQEILQVRYDVAVDKNNRIFAGGRQGVLMIENENAKMLKNDNTTFSDIVCIDNRNHIFSAAKQYLNLVEGDTIKTIHSFDNNYILGLLPFDNDNMIISTLKGFYIFNTKNFFEKDEIQLLFYNQNNGMIAIEPSFGQIFQDKEGMVWMVTSEQIVSFDAQKLIRQVSKPNLIVRNFAVSKDNVKWKNVDDLANTRFTYKDKNFKIEFIGLNYSTVENVRYHYRLLGFQNDWSEPVKNREVTFNNLPPGDYVFEIFADAGTDESRCETQLFTFSIKPAFWQTAWFPVVSIAFLMLASAGVALYIQRRKNKVLLEKLHAEKELNELRINSIRLKAIPHFNANVLSAIEYYIMNFSKEEANRLLNIYSEFIGRTLREVDKASRTLGEELEYTELYLKLEKLRFVDKFDYKINIAPEITNDVQLPNMILHTYCENAIKHGFAGRSAGCMLQISAEQKGDLVEVKVEDNGMGRKAAETNRNVRSTKQGLNILNRQIEIYNRFNKKKIVQQIIDLYDHDTPCGTCFIVGIPYGFVYN